MNNYNIYIEDFERAQQITNSYDDLYRKQNDIQNDGNNKKEKECLCIVLTKHVHGIKNHSLHKKTRKINFSETYSWI